MAINHPNLYLWSKGISHDHLDQLIIMITQLSTCNGGAKPSRAGRSTSCRGGTPKQSDCQPPVIIIIIIIVIVIQMISMIMIMISNLHSTWNTDILGALLRWMQLLTSPDHWEDY